VREQTHIVSCAHAPKPQAERRGIPLGSFAPDATRRRQGPPIASELAATCRQVGSPQWMEFERRNKAMCNQYCVDQGLPPWRADDYVNSGTVPAYEDVCQNRAAVTNTVR
jgi:hypothetical protein